MAVPMYILGLIVSTLFGALFHLWRGGGGGRLLIFLVLGWAGFLIGELVGRRLGLEFGSLGALHLGSALVVEFVFLLAAAWLSLPQAKKPSRPRR